MNKVLALVLLLVSLSARSQDLGQCQATDARLQITGPDISLTEMEERGLRPSPRGRPAPTLPWNGHKNWLTFKSTFRPGDRIRPYSLAFKLGEKPFQWGYALYRGDCLLLIFAVRVA